MTVTILTGDCRDVLRTLSDESVHCVVTSPPYWGLRDYGTAIWEGGDAGCQHIEVQPQGRPGRKTPGGRGGSFPHTERAYKATCGHCGGRRIDSQLGLEPDFSSYIATMVEVFRDVRRVLRPDGTLWLNLGDSYATGAGKVGEHPGGGEQGQKWRGNGSKHDYGLGPMTQPNRMPQPGLKPKDLCGIPWRVAFALQADGWYLRQDIIWSKPNPMPESVRDRCTKAHEYLFLLAKSERYYYDVEAIAEPHADDWHDRASTWRNGKAKQQGRGNTYHPFGERKPFENPPNPAGRNKRSVWEVTTQPFNDWGETVRRVRVAWDAPDDDKKRITSPGCPLHGDHFGQAANVCDDEHASDLLSHSGDNENDLGLTLFDDCAAIDSPHESESVPQNADLPVQSCSASAIVHNNEIHKMDHAPATDFACTASAQIPSRILDSARERGSCDLVEHMHENNSEADELACNSTFETVDCTAHKSMKTASSLASHGSDCTCEWYIEKTEKTSHFATFPPALIEPCILAGCPRGGTVLDPFGGAGTTGLVADRLGRSAILIELNPAYAEMAERRLKDDAGMFAEISRTTDDYDAHKDVAVSFSEAYRAIRARKAAGGPGWEPK